MTPDHSCKILILDDDEILCRGLAEILTDDQWRITTAFDLATARRIFLKENHNIVITDICLTGNDDDEGLTFLSWIKTLNPAVEVIVMSGFGTSRREREARRMGGYRFFHKPLDTTILFNLIGSMVREMDASTRPDLPRGPVSDAESMIMQRRYLEGDDASFNGLIYAYRPLVNAIVTSWFHLDQEESKDIFQEMSMEVLLKISRIRNLRPFIVGTTMNLCRMRIKKEWRLRPISTENLGKDTRKEMEEKLGIREALEHITPKHRTLIEGIFFEGLSYEEMAQRMHASIGSIGPTRKRALESLRAYLTR